MDANPNMTSEDFAPKGWRDVYTLLRDSRADVLKEVAAVKDEVIGVKAVVDTHLLAHSVHDAVLAERVSAEAAAVKNELDKESKATRRREAARTIVQTIVPIIAIILSILANAKP